jgi:hypothetical protein
MVQAVLDQHHLYQAQVSLTPAVAVQVAIQIMAVLVAQAEAEPVLIQ